MADTQWWILVLSKKFFESQIEHQPLRLEHWVCDQDRYSSIMTNAKKNI